MCKFCDGKDFFPFNQPEYRNIKAKIKKDEDGAYWLEFQNFRMLIYNCPFCGISLRTSEMKADVINNLPFLLGEEIRRENYMKGIKYVRLLRK